MININDRIKNITDIANSSKKLDTDFIKDAENLANDPKKIDPNLATIDGIRIKDANNVASKSKKRDDKKDTLSAIRLNSKIATETYKSKIVGNIYDLFFTLTKKRIVITILILFVFLYTLAYLPECSDKIVSLHYSNWFLYLSRCAKLIIESSLHLLSYIFTIVITNFIIVTKENENK